MAAYQQQEDGSWEPARALSWQPGLDVEHYEDGQWVIFRGPNALRQGRGRISLWWHMMRLRAAAEQEASS